MNKRWLKIYIILISGFFILSRVIFIFRFPLFFDEAIYIHWAQYISQNWVWRNVSLSLDGKQPLFIWLVAFSLKFITNPVIAGRVISVISGALSLTGIYLIAKKIYNQPVALISILLYTLIPFFLIYNSLALMDGILLMLSIYASLLTINLAKDLSFSRKRESLLGRFPGKPGMTQTMNLTGIGYEQWFSAIGLGVVIGLGLFTKSSAIFFFLTIPFGVLLFEKHTKVIYRTYISFCILAVVIAKCFEYLVLHDYFTNIAHKNAEFVKSWVEVTQTPINNILNQVVQIGGWIFGYLGVGVVFLAIVALFISPKKRVTFYFLLLTLLPLIPYMVFSKQAYPRHLLFMSWPLLILASSAIVCIYHKINYSRIWIFIIMLIIIVPAAVNSTLLLFNPLHAKLPEIERWQFLTGEPSGWGIEKLYRFFDERSDKKLLILTDKPLGILPGGIAIRYFKNSTVKVIGLDEVNSLQIRKFRNEFQPDEIFIVMSWQNLPDDIPAHKEFEIERPGTGNKNWRVYKAL